MAIIHCIQYTMYIIHANATFIKGFLAQIDETALTLRWVAIRNSRKSMKPSLSLETQVEFLIIAFDLILFVCDWNCMIKPYSTYVTKRHDLFLSLYTLDLWNAKIKLFQKSTSSSCSSVDLGTSVDPTQCWSWNPLVKDAKQVLHQRLWIPHTNVLVNLKHLQNHHFLWTSTLRQRFCFLHSNQRLFFWIRYVCECFQIYF